MRRVECCIPGCTLFPLRESWHMCGRHWEQYGGGDRKTREKWVTECINRRAREVYYQRTHGARQTSLDELMDAGKLSAEEMHIFKAPGSKRRRRTRRQGGTHAKVFLDGH